MLIIWGLRIVYLTIGQGVFFCRRCGGDRDYRHRSGRRFITVFFIPLIPLARTGEHIQCLTCKTRYVTEVLDQPTAAQMQDQLPAGLRALAVVMLNAGDQESGPARRRAIDVVRDAGDREFGESALDVDLAKPREAHAAAIVALGGQLQAHAREWYLAEAIRIGLADGPLSPAERTAAEYIAATLGMTQAQAIGVTALTEQAAGQS
jgi:hypothetical protein